MNEGGRESVAFSTTPLHVRTRNLLINHCARLGMRVRSQTVGVHLLIAFSYGLLAIMFTFPLIVKATQFVPMPSYLFSKPWLHDHWMTLWGFWHTKRSLLTSGHFPLSTDEIFYPVGVSMPYITTVLFPLTASVPFQAAFGLILGSNILRLLFAVVAAYGAFRLVDDLVQDRFAAFFAGVVFGYSPFMLARLQGHDLIVAGSALIPWYTLFLLRTLRAARWSNPLLAAGLFGLILLSTWYYAPLLVILSSVLCLYDLLSRRPPPKPQGRMARLLLLLGAAGVVALPVVAPMRSLEGQDFLWLTPESLRWASLDLMAFFVPSADHFVLGPSVQALRDRFLGDPTLQTAFVGYTVLLLAGLAWLRTPRHATTPWLWVAIVFFLLALGPTLHIHGADTFHIAGRDVRVPLPFALFGYVPLVPYLGGATAIGLSVVILMLALTVLVGYGITSLRHTLACPWAWRVPALLLAVLVLEYAALPLPLWEVRVPEVYQIIRNDPHPGVVLDLPFADDIKIYQFYQTTHEKRIVSGFVPRLPLVNRTFGDNIRLVRMLKDPRLIPHDPRDSSLAEEGQAVGRLLNIRYIVIHKDYFSSGASDRVATLVNTAFPVHVIAQDEHIIAYRVADADGDVRAVGPPYLIDFGTESGFPALLAGWSPAEFAHDLTYAWSNAQESTAWLYLPYVTTMKMDLRLFPFTFPSSPNQRVSVSMNGERLGELALEGRWQTYSLDLPRSHLREGVNTIRFRYGYTAAPATVIPGNNDRRRLAVAFDYIALRPQ